MCCLTIFELIYKKLDNTMLLRKIDVPTLGI